MIKYLIATCASVMFFAGSMNALGQDDFKPQLQKLTINGQELYQAGSLELKTLDIDTKTTTKLEYTFINQGTSVSSKELMVFVHFEKDGEILVGGDFSPSIASTNWLKDKIIALSNSVDLAKLKGKEVYI